MFQHFRFTLNFMIWFHFDVQSVLMFNTMPIVFAQDISVRIPLKIGRPCVQCSDRFTFSFQSSGVDEFVGFFGV